MSENVKPAGTPFSWRFYLHNPELTASMIILLGFLILTSMQVFSRFVLNLPFDWTEELTASLVIWMTFLGAAAVQKEDTQVRVEIIESILSRNAVNWLYFAFDMCSLCFLLALMYGGWLTLDELAYEKTPALQIPYKYLFAVIPLSSFLMSIYIVRNSIRRFKKRGSSCS